MARDRQTWSWRLQRAPWRTGYRLQASHRVHGPGISWGFEGGEVGGRRDNSTNVGTRRRRGVRVAVVVGGVDSEASGSAKSAPHSAMTPMPSKTCLSTTLLFRVSSTLRLAALACCKPVNRGSHSPPSAWPATDHRRLLSPSPSHRPHELCLCLTGRSALLRRRRTACRQLQRRPLSTAHLGRNLQGSPTPAFELKLAVHRYRD